MHIFNLSNHQQLAAQAEAADSFVRRLKGLMLRPELPPGQALIIEPCNMIHTHFMRFPIDVLFVGADKEILHVIEAMCPWRQSPRVKGACYVIELPAGTVQGTGTQKGQRLDW